MYTPQGVVCFSPHAQKNFAFCGKICYTVLATQTNTVSKDKDTFFGKNAVSFFALLSFEMKSLCRSKWRPAFFVRSLPAAHFLFCARRQTRTKFLLPLMLLCIALFALALTASAETYTGECGENLTYTLDTDTGVLAIAGSGKMTDWSVSMKLIKCHGITIEPQFAPCKSQKP